jgi:ATP-dependent RNA helicase SUPV3L1/SUV3
LKNGGVRQPGIAELPHIILSGRTSFPIDKSFDKRLYEVAGFKVAGERIVRVDILERLADIIRPLVAYDANRPVDTPPPEGAAEGNGFRVTVEMTSLLGCAGEDFASILKSLGYRVRRTPKAPAEVAPAENQLAEPVADTALAEAALEGAPVESVPTPSSEPIAEAALAEASIAVADAEPVPAAMEASPAEAEAATPAEPEYDEVWFPAGRRPERNNRPQRNKPDGNRAPRPEGQQRFKGKGGKPNHHNGKGPREDRPNDRPRPERREKPIDPDSPFAALAALKTRK